MQHLQTSLSCARRHPCHVARRSHRRTRMSVSAKFV
jgi:hypothetical protein